MPTPPALTETPSGDLSNPFFGVASLLANSTTFQAMVGATDAAGAMAFIDYPLRDVMTYGYPIPGAIITDDDSLPGERKRLQIWHGQLLLLLYDEMDSTYYGDGVTIDWRNDDIAMRNRFGAILKEMLDLRTNIWAITGWRKAGSPTHLGPPDVQRENEDAQKWFRYGAFIVEAMG
jgi:hypothetical protein